MPAFGNVSLRKKQMLIILLITSISLLLACSAFVLLERHNYRKEMSQNLAALAQTLGNNVAGSLDFNDVRSATDTLQGLRTQPHIVGAVVFTETGKVFTSYDRPDDNIIFAPPVLPLAEGLSFGPGRLSVFESVTSKGDVIGKIYLESDMDALNAKLAEFAYITAAVFILTMMVAVFLSAWLQRLILEPILELVRTTRAVALDRNYSVRVAKKNSDEIGVLIDGFNEMLSQIQQRESALQSAHDELEQRVAARTSELAAANDSLRGEIAERKKAVESLRLLGSAVEQAEDSIVITDALLDKPGPRILFANPAFTRMTGYSVAEVLGKTPRILQGAGTDKAVMARLRQTLARGEPFHCEGLNYRKDRTEFRFELHIAPIRDANGSVTHFVAIKRDITERRQFEARLFQSQKMETVGKLAGGVAHEFNSVMTAIIGQSELMLCDLPENSPLRKNATEIRHSADRAAALTRQLLAYGRKQLLRPDVLDLNVVLAGMDNTIRHLCGRDVDVRIVPSGRPMLIRADAGQIEQVIVNIVMNAADAMPRGGKLTLETEETTLGQEYASQYTDVKPGDYIMLAISDTGAGMTEAVKARIFEPFFTTKDIGQGTGLGLATCHGIIKQSGGHINFYSELGRGATFKIYLPKMVPSQRSAVTASPASSLPRGTETILLVEDDRVVRLMAASLLGRLGYTVLTAGNGLEAMNVTNQSTTGRIDLLFTDVVMPHMSGRELSDRIRAFYPKTRVLFTSAYTESAIMHQKVLTPGDSLLQKPYTPTALASRVRQALDHPEDNNGTDI